MLFAIVITITVIITIIIRIIIIVFVSLVFIVSFNKLWLTSSRLLLFLILCKLASYLLRYFIFILIVFSLFFFYHLNTILGAIISLHAYIYTFQNCVFSPPLFFLFSFFFLENMYFFVLYIIYVSLYFSYYRTYITLLRLLCVFPRRIYTTGQVDIVDDTTSTSSSSSYSKRRCTTVRMLLQKLMALLKEKHWCDRRVIQFRIYICIRDTERRMLHKGELRYDEKRCSWGRQFVSVPLQLWLAVLAFRFSSMLNFFVLCDRNEHINIVWLSFDGSSILVLDFFRSSLFLFSVIASSCVHFSSENLLNDNYYDYGKLRIVKRVIVFVVDFERLGAKRNLENNIENLITCNAQ